MKLAYFKTIVFVILNLCFAISNSLAVFIRCIQIFQSPEQLFLCCLRAKNLALTFILFRYVLWILSEFLIAFHKIRGIVDLFSHCQVMRLTVEHWMAKLTEGDLDEGKHLSLLLIHVQIEQIVL